MYAESMRILSTLRIIPAQNLEASLRNFTLFTEKKVKPLWNYNSNYIEITCEVKVVRLTKNERKSTPVGDCCINFCKMASIMLCFPHCSTILFSIVQQYCSTILQNTWYSRSTLSCFYQWVISNLQYVLAPIFTNLFKKLLFFSPKYVIISFVTICDRFSP